VKAGTQGQASMTVHASPTVLYDAVSDVRRMGEWSPECRNCSWVGGATSPVVGAHFKGSNRRGMARWSTTPQVVAADPAREFAFVTGHRGREMTRWSYRFEATSEGTEVTETFQMLSDMPWYFRLADRLLMGVTDRRADLEASMCETLRNLKSAIEEPDSNG
jgi:Polyketide cyclase / dehydrase and lipid transport